MPGVVLYVHPLTPQFLLCSSADGGFLHMNMAIIFL